MKNDPLTCPTTRLKHTNSMKNDPVSCPTTTTSKHTDSMNNDPVTCPTTTRSKQTNSMKNDPVTCSRFASWFDGWFAGSVFLCFRFCLNGKAMFH